MSNPKIEALLEELNSYIRASEKVDDLIGEITEQLTVIERFDGEEFRRKVAEANRAAHIRPHEADAISSIRKMIRSRIYQASEANGTLAGNIRHVMDKIRSSIR